MDKVVRPKGLPSLVRKMGPDFTPFSLAYSKSSLCTQAGIRRASRFRLGKVTIVPERTASTVTLSNSCTAMPVVPNNLIMRYSLSSPMALAADNMRRYSFRESSGWMAVSSTLALTVDWYSRKSKKPKIPLMAVIFMLTVLEVYFPIKYSWYS